MSTISLPQIRGADLLTHSRMACFKRCPREHYYRYEMGIRPAGEAAPLRIGSLVHHAIELRANKVSDDGIHESIDNEYAKRVHDGMEVSEMVALDVERVTVHELVRGYFNRWATDYQIITENADPLSPVESILSESSFRLSIRNPRTGRAMPGVRQAGKIDEIVRLADGRVALKETKTTGDSIDPDSDYWLKLRLDHQISLYMLAAQESGYPVETIIYDVIRKPGIEPRQVPIVDDDGVKIVRDQSGERVRTKDGKKWRETGDAAMGYTLQVRSETPCEFGDRLRADIASRPEFYFARREIPRLSKDLDEFRDELYQQAQAIRDARKHGRWYRNPSACSMMGRCSFLPVCHQGFTPDNIPPGYVRVENVHPELTGD